MACLAILLFFSKFPEDGLHNDVFSLTVPLAKVEKLALAPLDVGSLYVRLDERSSNIFLSASEYNIITYVDASFLQMSL